MVKLCCLKAKGNVKLVKTSCRVRVDSFQNHLNVCGGPPRGSDCQAFT